MRGTGSSTLLPKEGDFKFLLLSTIMGPPFVVSVPFKPKNDKFVTDESC